jgi:hypothetical protein
LAEEFAITARTHPNLGPRGNSAVLVSRRVASRLDAPEHATGRAGENRRADGNDVGSHLRIEVETDDEWVVGCESRTRLALPYPDWCRTMLKRYLTRLDLFAKLMYGYCDAASKKAKATPNS